MPTLNETAHKTHTIESAEQEIAATGALLNPPCKCFADRHLLEQWLVNKVNKNALDDYMIKFNARSQDGLVALRAARKLNGEWLWIGDVWAWACKTFGFPPAILLGVCIGVVLTVLGELIPAILTGESIPTGFLSLSWKLLFSLRGLVFKFFLVLRIVALHLELLMRDMQTMMISSVSMAR